MAPQNIAQKLASACSQIDGIDQVAAVGGYVNIWLAPRHWHDVLRSVLTCPLKTDGKGAESGSKVLVEFVSANPTGPLHTGHVRGAILGDTIARLLQAVGHQVTREYFINDAGNQMEILARTVRLHCQALESGTTPDIPQGYYPGAYVQDIARAFMQSHKSDWQNADSKTLRAFAMRFMMREIQQDLDRIGVTFDVLTSEQAMIGAGWDQKATQILRDQGFVHKGILEKPLGHETSDWQPEELVLFRSTAFGDDQDRALYRADGSPTYFCADVGYHSAKLARGYKNLINIWGADHASHVQRMKSAVKALSGQELEVQVCQMVHFYSHGQLLKNSKRAGTFVTLADLLDQIDPDVLRFMMITKKADTHLDLDMQVMQDQSKDNPVFYIQYAHARCCSVLRENARLFGENALLPQALAHADLGLLEELDLIRILADWPRQLQEAAQAREPHRIAAYLHQVAHQFHALWNKGNAQSHLRFVHPDNQALSMAASALVQATALTLAAGLGVLGIKAKSELR
jgi:arginyl-tRNA synthetase